MAPATRDGDGSGRCRRLGAGSAEEGSCIRPPPTVLAGSAALRGLGVSQEENRMVHQLKRGGRSIDCNSAAEASVFLAMGWTLSECTTLRERGQRG